MSKETNIGLIVKNAGIDTVGNAFSTIFTFAASVVITRTIGAELFGKYSLANSVIQVLAVFAVFGLNSGVVRLTSKYNATGDAPRVKGTLISGIALSAVMSAILVLLVVLLAPLLSAKVFTNIEGIGLILKVYIIALPFYALMFVINGYTQGLKTLKYSVIVEMIARPVVRLIAVVILFLLGFRLFGVVIGGIVSFVFAAGLAFYYARRRSPFDYRSIRAKLVTNEIFFYSLPLVFSRFMNILIGRSNTILVGYFKDPTATGLFGAAVTLSPFIGFGLISLGKIFAPVISELWEKRDRDELRNTLKTVSKWCFSTGWPIFLIVMLFAPGLLLVLGPEFRVAATTLRLLALGQMINAIVGPAGHFIAMTGRPKLNLVNAVALAVANVVLNIIMIPRWGIEGAGLATAISLAAINIVRVVEIKVLYGLTPFRADLYKPALAGAIAAGVFYFLNVRLGWHDIMHTLLLSGAFLILYIVLLYLFGLKEEKEVLIEILRRRK